MLAINIVLNNAFRLFQQFQCKTVSPVNSFRLTLRSAFVMEKKVSAEATTPLDKKLKQAIKNRWQAKPQDFVRKNPVKY